MTADGGDAVSWASSLSWEWDNGKKVEMRDGTNNKKNVGKGKKRSEWPNEFHCHR